MRNSGLAHNSISSYTRVLRTYLKWCREQDYTTVVMPPIKDIETVKETYTDEELRALLQKPDKHCDFTEYRNWVIINFLMNCGCRAATIRNIQNRDLDLSSRQVCGIFSAKFFHEFLLAIHKSISVHFCISFFILVYANMGALTEKQLSSKSS